MFISTTYEPRAVYVKQARPTPGTDLWYSADGAEWRKVFTLPDGHQMHNGLPARPLIAFPAGAPGKRLFFTPSYIEGNPYYTGVLNPAALRDSIRMAGD
jgi:hypothetical protein